MMAYQMQIFPALGKEENEPVPAAGDVFVVEKVDAGVLDMHWGKCTVVELRRAKPGEFAVINQPTIRPVFTIDPDDYR